MSCLLENSVGGFDCLHSEHACVAVVSGVSVPDSFTLSFAIVDASALSVSSADAVHCLHRIGFVASFRCLLTAFALKSTAGSRLRPHFTQSKLPCHCDGSPPEVTPREVIGERRPGVEGRPSVSSAFPDEYWKKVVRIMNKTQAQRRKKAKKDTFIENYRNFSSAPIHGPKRRGDTSLPGLYMPRKYHSFIITSVKTLSRRRPPPHVSYTMVVARRDDRLTDTRNEI